LAPKPTRDKYDEYIAEQQAKFQQMGKDLPMYGPLNGVPVNTPLPRNLENFTLTPQTTATERKNSYLAFLAKTEQKTNDLKASYSEYLAKDLKPDFSNSNSKSSTANKQSKQTSSIPSRDQSSTSKSPKNLNLSRNQQTSIFSSTNDSSAKVNPQPISQLPITSDYTTSSNLTSTPIEVKTAEEFCFSKHRQEKLGSLSCVNEDGVKTTNNSSLLTPVDQVNKPVKPTSLNSYTTGDYKTYLPLKPGTNYIDTKQLKEMVS
jgi:hypothetical protein